jgi:transposase
MEERQQRNRRQFTAEFKRDAVDLVRTTGRPIAEIARELGIYDSTLGNWVRQDRIDRGEAEGLTTEERARRRQLEAENTKLRMERDLLKRTVAFWVRRRRRRDALPRCRCPEGRRVPGRSRLPGGRGDQVGVLRLDRRGHPRSG